MQLHEFGNVIGEIVGIPQLAHPLLRHSRTHDLVVVKADPSSCFELACLGFTDVVQQCREAQCQIGLTRGFVDRFEGDRLLENRQCVLLDVLMVMVFVCFEAKKGKFWKNDVRDAGVHQ